MHVLLFVALFGVFLKHTVLSQIRDNNNNAALLAEYFEVPIQIETVAEDPTFAWIESPLWSETGQYLLFSDVKWEKNGETPGMIWRWDETDGLTKFLEDAGIVGPGDYNISGLAEGGPNGMVWGWEGEGDLLFCQHGQKRIARVNVADVMNGAVASDKVKVVSDMYDGKRFNSPNDMTLVDGKLYFTDPVYGLSRIGDIGFEPSFSRMTQPVTGVYVIPSDGAAPELILDDVTRPNGIAFSSAGNVFIAYTDNDDPHFRLYDGVTAYNDFGNEYNHLTSLHRINRTVNDIDFALNDGVTAYKDVILGAGPGGVYILNGTDGHEIGFIRVDDLVSNVEIGGGYLWVTANHKLKRIKLKEMAPPDPSDPSKEIDPESEQSSGGDPDASGSLKNCVAGVLLLIVFNLIL